MDTMSSIVKRAKLFHRSMIRFKEAEKFELIELIQVIGKLFNDQDSKIVVEDIIKNYNNNPQFRKSQKYFNAEIQYASMLSSLLNKYSVKDAIQAITMWTIVQRNMPIFQRNLCWVSNKKELHLKNSKDSRYITWIKEGKTYPILRRWFNNYYEDKSIINVQQIYALIDIIKIQNIGLEMSQKKFDAVLVMDTLKGKNNP